MVILHVAMCNGNTAYSATGNAAYSGTGYKPIANAAYRGNGYKRDVIHPNCISCSK